MRTIRLFFFFVILTSCTAKYVVQDEFLKQVDIFGVSLYSDFDYTRINGEAASEEPCLRGYERSFDNLNISIGYGFDKRIRKITTRNSSTSLFGIKPGMSFSEGKSKIKQAGFTELTPPFKFKAKQYSIAFLVDEDDRIFGITFETLD